MGTNGLIWTKIVCMNECALFRCSQSKNTISCSTFDQNEITFIPILLFFSFKLYLIYILMKFGVGISCLKRNNLGLIIMTMMNLFKK